jgi:hypothetical protein
MEELRRWENTIKMGIKEMCRYEELAQDRDH